MPTHRAYERPLETDPFSKSRKRFYKDTDGLFHIWDEAEVDDIVMLNAEAQKYVDARTPYGDMERVASIPLPLVARLKKEGIWDDDKALLKWLDRPENRAWRTRGGSLSK